MSSEGAPRKQGYTTSNNETVIINPLKQREWKAVFCGMSVGLTAPEERSRDHVCGAIIRQEGFLKGSALITLTAHEKGPLVYQFTHPMRFRLPPKLHTHMIPPSAGPTHMYQKTVVVNIKA